MVGKSTVTHPGQRHPSLQRLSFKPKIFNFSATSLLFFRSSKGALATHNRNLISAFQFSFVVKFGVQNRIPKRESPWLCYKFNFMPRRTRKKIKSMNARLILRTSLGIEKNTFRGTEKVIKIWCKYSTLQWTMKITRSR